MRILDICIPTYNRKTILKTNLENILEIISDYDVKINVSDNGSKDGTEEMIKEMSNRTDKIIYKNNYNNLGVDKNLELALKLSGAKYSWLLGDDDTLTKNISTVIKTLKKLSPDILVIGVDRKMKKERLYTDPNQILEELSGTMGWISSLIVSKDIVNQMNYKKYCGTGFVHVGAVLDYVATSSNILVAFLPRRYNIVSVMRHDCSFGNKGIELFVITWVKLILMLPGEYNLESKFKAFTSPPTVPYRVSSLVLFRGKRYLDARQLIEDGQLLRVISPFKYYRALIILKTPVLICKVLTKVYLLILENKKRRRDKIV